uniref:Ion transport domain-containing protein n=2 Tax=Kalmanozyma brasiliensis (strain GHG001) TaxID=1365824 RepID=V5EW34_KALBG
MASPYPSTANGDGPRVDAPREVSIGVGTVYDQTAFSSNGYTRPDDSHPPLRSHYFLSRNEILKGVANRFVHSSAYLYFYASMALASLLTVIISLTSDCPGSLFYGLELAINLLLIAEVGIRLVAFGKQFWKSTYNVVDLFLVLLCAVTLLVIFFHHECSPFRRPSEDGEPGRSGKGEELLDSILLIGRNVVQALRLVSIVRRSGSNVTSRPSRIEIGNRPYSLDLDLEDEGAMARDRIRIGEEERAPLFDAEEDEL